MSFAVNFNVKRNKTLEELDQLYFEATLKFCGNGELLAYIFELKEYGKEMVSWVHEYDFRDIQANGYRSVLNLGIKMLRFCLLKYGVSEKQDAEVLRLVKTFRDGIKYVALIREDSLIQSNGTTVPLASSPVYFVSRFLTTFLRKKSHLHAIFGPFNGFSHKPSVQVLVKMYLMYVAFNGAKTVGSAFRCLFDASYRTEQLVNVYSQYDIVLLKKMLSGSEGMFYTTILPRIVHGFNSVKTVHIKRQNKWVINFDYEEKQIFINDCGLDYGAQPVRCRLMREPASGPGAAGRLMIFAHGGGFICNKAESHEIFLRGWAKKLSGVTILSVDYSLSPEAKFPVSIQEVLDVYLWTMSDDPEVEKVIGFRPKRVLFCGDSSGGLMLMTVIMALNDIRKSHPEASIKLPHSFLGVYSSFTFAPQVLPSYFLGAFHFLLFPSVIANMIGAYFPEKSFISSQITPNPEVAQTVGEKVSAFFRYIYSLLCIRKEMTVEPWFLKEKDNLETYLTQNLRLLSHPYFSPLLYADFEGLSSVSMYLIALHSDPILDSSIAMASKWKGLVTLDVVSGLSHGFLNFMFWKRFNGEIERGDDLCLRRIRQALKLGEEPPGG